MKVLFPASIAQANARDVQVAAVRAARQGHWTFLQILVNGLMLGGLYACIAVGFSLVWGVLNVINILHGTFIVLGVLHRVLRLRISAFIRSCRSSSSPALLFALGWVLQAGIINRVIAAPVLITLTLTFGLDLILNNAMLVAFTADYRAGSPSICRQSSIALGVVLPGDRVAAMALALLLTVLLYRLLRDSSRSAAPSSPCAWTATRRR